MNVQAYWLGGWMDLFELVSKRQIIVFGENPTTLSSKFYILLTVHHIMIIGK